jgi:hypothetical protein
MSFGPSGGGDVRYLFEGFLIIERDRVMSKTTTVSIRGPSIKAILGVLGETDPGNRRLQQGASVELAGGVGSLVVEDVSKSAGFDSTTVVVTFTTALTQGVIIELLKARLTARRPLAPDRPLPQVTVVVGDVHVS